MSTVTDKLLINIVTDELFKKCIYGTFLGIGENDTISELKNKYEWNGLSIVSDENINIDQICNEKYNNIIHYIYVKNNCRILNNILLNKSIINYCLEIENCDNINLPNYILYKSIGNRTIYVSPELINKKVVNSFDFFDTLVHRYYMTENSNIELVAKQTKVIDFVKIRKEYEGSGESLEDIYKNMNCKLYENEMNLELENLYLNMNNYKNVKPNDIIISDTYYDAHEFETILQKFNIRNKYYRSKSGKRAGYIYKQLKEEYVIICHIGDNPISDGIKAKENNINNFVQNFGKCNIVEDILMHIKMSNIAFLMRKLRLTSSNMVDKDDMIIIGQLTYLINLLIYQIVINCLKHNKTTNVLLTMRDCCHLYNFFVKFNPDVKYEKLYTSRKAYLKNSQSFNDYFKSLLNESNNVILDMNGTGKSVLDFLKINDYKNINVLYVVKFNTFPINCIFDDPRLIDILELVNYDTKGSCIDYDICPVLNDVEYDIKEILQIHNFVNCGLEMANICDISDNLIMFNNEHLKAILYKFLLLYSETEYCKNARKNHK